MIWYRAVRRITKSPEYQITVTPVLFYARVAKTVKDMAENAAEGLMIVYLSELIRAIAEPSSLACDLFARRIIPRSVYNEAIGCKSGISKQDKCVSICDAVLQSIHVTPSHLVEFVAAARQDSPAVNDLCQEISKDPAYGKVVNFVVTLLWYSAGVRHPAMLDHQ